MTLSTYRIDREAGCVLVSHRCPISIFATENFPLNAKLLAEGVRDKRNLDSEDDLHSMSASVICHSLRAKISKAKRVSQDLSDKGFGRCGVLMMLLHSNAGMDGAGC